MLTIVTTQSALIQALVVRGIVFVEEQQVPYYLECDSYDRPDHPHAIHILALQQSASGQMDEPIGTGRLIFKKDATDDSYRVKLERIAVRAQYRGKGVGREIVAFMLAQCQARQVDTVYMHAQLYLQRFYEDLGFTAKGDIFEEAGIQHRYMVYSKGF